MVSTGARLLRLALEQLKVGLVFSAPEVQSREVFEELALSSSLELIQATQECSAAYMADAASRISARIGTLLVTRGAGLTRALSGIAEAALDGIPMLILSVVPAMPPGPVEDVDLQAMLVPLTKRVWRVSNHNEMIPALFMAYREAFRGRPGPVMVELAQSVLQGVAETGVMPTWPGVAVPNTLRGHQLGAAASALLLARNPVLVVGWGARNATPELVELAESLGAPVVTTLQGLSSFPANHALHAGAIFGGAALSVVRQVLDEADCLLVVGTSLRQMYGARPGPKLGVEMGAEWGAELPIIHIDIDERVFAEQAGRRIALVADAGVALRALLGRVHEELAARRSGPQATQMASRISRSKLDHLHAWRQPLERGEDVAPLVNPARLFQTVDGQWAHDALVIADEGRETLLTAELLPMIANRRFIAPTAFRCLGYALPAAISAKLCFPEREVLAVVGERALLISGMELITAALQRLGIVILVCAEGPPTPAEHKVPVVNLHAAAIMSGCAYHPIFHDDDIEAALLAAREAASIGCPAIVDVRLESARPLALALPAEPAAQVQSQNAPTLAPPGQSHAQSHVAASSLVANGAQAIAQSRTQAFTQSTKQFLQQSFQQSLQQSLEPVQSSLAPQFAVNRAH